MGDPAPAGLTLSYAPTQRAITSPVIQVDESGELVAAIPAEPLWSQLIPKALHLSLALVITVGAGMFTGMLWREAEPPRMPVVYVSTALTAAMLWWVLTCVRSVVVACRFGHRPAI